MTRATEAPERLRTPVTSVLAHVFAEGASRAERASLTLFARGAPSLNGGLQSRVNDIIESARDMGSALARQYVAHAMRLREAVAPVTLRVPTLVPRWAAIAAELVDGLQDDGALPREAPSTLFAPLRAPLLRSIHARIIIPQRVATARGVVAGVATHVLRRWLELICRTGPAPRANGSPAHEWRRLLLARPCLLRGMAERVALAADAASEVLRHLDEDGSYVAELLGVPVAETRSVRAMSCGLGDPHGGGRTVVILDLTCGARVVYKPRPGAAADWFERLHNAVLASGAPKLALRFPRQVSRPMRSWQEFVEAQPATSPSGIERFYERVGALLALGQAARVQDLHGENLVADGEYPVPIDLEVIGVPAPAVSGSGEAAPSIVDSVGLLPTPVTVAGGALRVESTFATRHADGADQVLCTPFADARPGFAEDYEAPLLHGYQFAARALWRRRAVWEHLGADLHAHEPRFVARPTSLYAGVFDRAFAAASERSTPALELALEEGLLETPDLGGELAEIAEEEVWGLTHGDVPMFAASADFETVTPAGAFRPIRTSLRFAIARPETFDRAGVQMSVAKICERLCLLRH